MSEKQITIHIGLPKTATTFIQEVVLPKYNTVSVIRGWYSHRQILDTDFNKNIIISDESISGRLFSGHFSDDFSTNLKKIKQLYGNPKIVFGIRKQDSFILSIYKQYLNEKGWKNIDYIFNIKNTGILKKEDLFLETKIKLIHSLFENVFVYSQESIKSNVRKFIESLTKFIELDESIDIEKLKNKASNVGMNSKSQIALIQKLNRINNVLEKLPIIPGLYSLPFKVLKITPRNLCQDYLKGTKSKAYNLDNNLSSFLHEYYKNDWEKAISYLSY